MTIDPRWTAALAFAASLLALGGLSRPAAAQLDACPSFDQLTDKTAPSSTIVSAPTDPTNQASPTISYTADEPAIFECRIDGALVACPGIATAGEIASVVVGPLVDGPHTFTVSATDAIGNPETQPAEATFTLDTTGPLLTITNPAQGSTLADAASVLLQGEASEELSQIQAFATDDFGRPSGPFPVSITSLPGDLPVLFEATLPVLQGKQRLRVDAVDIAGNPASASVSVRVLDDGPGLQVLSPAPNASLSAAPSHVVVSLSESATLSSGSPFLIVPVGPVLPGVLEIPVHAALLADPGINVIDLTATDAAGNASSVETQFSLQTPGGPVARRVEKVSGDNQTNPLDPGQPTMNDMVVRVTDFDPMTGTMTPAAGVAVRWGNPDTPFLTTTTDANGMTALQNVGWPTVTGFIPATADPPTELFEDSGASELQAFFFVASAAGVIVGGTPALITVISGNFQRCIVDQPAADPLVVEVKDAALNWVQGVDVSFAVVSMIGGAPSGAVSAASPTDATGRTQVTFDCGPSTLTEPPVALVRAETDIFPTRVAQHVVEAQAGAAIAQLTTFGFPGNPSQIAVAPATIGGTDDTSPQMAFPSFSAPAGLVAAVTDGNGNPVGNARVRVQLGSPSPPPQSPTFLPAAMRTDITFGFPFGPGPLAGESGGVAELSVLTDSLGRSRPIAVVAGSAESTDYPFDATLLSSMGQPVAATQFVVTSETMLQETDTNRDLASPVLVFDEGFHPLFDWGAPGEPVPPESPAFLVLRENLARDANGDLVRDANGHVVGSDQFFVDRAERAGTPITVSIEAGGDGVLSSIDTGTTGDPITIDLGEDGVAATGWTLGPALGPSVLEASIDAVSLPRWDDNGVLGGNEVAFPSVITLPFIGKRKKIEVQTRFVAQSVDAGGNLVGNFMPIARAVLSLPLKDNSLDFSSFAPRERPVVFHLELEAAEDLQSGQFPDPQMSLKTERIVQPSGALEQIEVYAEIARRPPKLVDPAQNLYRSAPIIAVPAGIQNIRGLDVPAGAPFLVRASAGLDNEPGRLSFQAPIGTKRTRFPSTPVIDVVPRTTLRISQVPVPRADGQLPSGVTFSQFQNLQEEQARTAQRAFIDYCGIDVEAVPAAIPLPYTPSRANPSFVGGTASLPPASVLQTIADAKSLTASNRLAAIYVTTITSTSGQVGGFAVGRDAVSSFRDLTEPEQGSVFLAENILGLDDVHDRVFAHEIGHILIARGDEHRTDPNRIMFTPAAIDIWGVSDRPGLCLDAPPENRSTSICFVSRPFSHRFAEQVECGRMLSQTPDSTLTGDQRPSPYLTGWRTQSDAF